MKINYILCAAGIAFSQLAMAESSVTGQLLGTVQATIDFCAQINPGAAMKYQEQVGLIAGEVSEQELDRARNSGEFKEAYEQARTALGVVSRQDATEACNSLLEANQPGPGAMLSENERAHDEQSN